MKKSITRIIVILGVIIMTPVQAADKPSAEKALTIAREQLEKSVAMHGGWQSTKKLIADAELSAAKGDYTKAIDKANQAMREARLSYEQAQRESKTWSEPDYLKNSN